MIDFSIPGLMDVPPVIALTPAADMECYIDGAIVGHYDADPVFYGDTWDGLPQVTIKVNGATPTEALGDVTVEFYRDGYTPGGRTPTTGCLLTVGEGVVIVSAENWIIQIPPIVLPLDRGLWKFNIRVMGATTNDRKTRIVATLPIV